MKFLHVAIFVIVSLASSADVMFWRISRDNPFVYANEIESPSIDGKLELYDMAVDFVSNEGYEVEVSFLKECLYNCNTWSHDKTWKTRLR